MNIEKNELNDFSLVLASSVHDMKNSLGMLLASLEDVMAKVNSINPECKNDFSILQYEAARINSELVRLLSVYRFQNDRMPINVDEHHVIDLIEDQIAKNQPLLTSRNISIDIDCDDSLTAFFDFELLGGVINDALVNSSRYSRERILIVVRAVDEFTEIAIHDDGDGFPVDMLGLVDDKTGVNVEFSERTHLGLYLAMRIARLHKSSEVCGQVFINNNSLLGGGSFVLSIP
ncbi:sensor histidine kinase [Sessilibacter corallicola]|uniref:sensor histidine kinase n=1 Tax=Sessilibacter corallicola TaxID=2904075 RepID=UPI001E61E07F|nr:HAMP domain-containing sensor histidine kinase [Sessilibacter corallicola]MCE2028963.1 HAMP domain-containing histidine kinase [Sessilibacter corallicola]